MTLNSDIKQELDELAITTRNAGLEKITSWNQDCQEKYQ